MIDEKYNSQRANMELVPSDNAEGINFAYYIFRDLAIVSTVNMASVLLHRQFSK